MARNRFRKEFIQLLLRNSLVFNKLTTNTHENYSFTQLLAKSQSLLDLLTLM